MSVRKKTTRLELVERIHQLSKINQNDCQIQITCKWPVAHRHYQAGSLLTMKARVMLDLYPSVNAMEVYVEKIFVINKFPEVQGESFMLDLDNELTSFMSPVPHISHVDVLTYNT